MTDYVFRIMDNPKKLRKILGYFIKKVNISLRNSVYKVHFEEKSLILKGGTLPN